MTRLPVHGPGGFGLGLAIVQAIAEAHNGSARASSTPGHGSVFEVQLPLVPAAPPAEPPAAAAPVTAPPPPTGSDSPA